MSHDRNALITAYRAMYGGTDIEADRVVRGVELAYAEQQNTELLKALDEADAKLENQRRAIRSIQGDRRKARAEAKGRKAYAEDLKAALINRHVDLCELEEKYQAVKQAHDDTYELIDKHTPYSRAIPLANVVNWLITMMNDWRRQAEEDARELRQVRVDGRVARSILFDAGVYAETLGQGITELVARQQQNP